jgi:hypothetical protein
MGGVARLVEVLERVVTSAEISELEVGCRLILMIQIEVQIRIGSGLTLIMHAVQVAILTVVFKALYNVCADDAQPGLSLSERPSVTEEEIMNVEAIVEHIRSSDDFSDHGELIQLSGRLVGQLALITRKLDALNLEPL